MKLIREYDFDDDGDSYNSIDLESGVLTFFRPFTRGKTI